MCCDLKRDAVGFSCSSRPQFRLFPGAGSVESRTGGRVPSFVVSSQGLRSPPENRQVESSDMKQLERDSPCRNVAYMVDFKGICGGLIGR